jgi:hypothetical protein
VGAALAMAEGTFGIGSAGRADKATVAASEVLGPRVYGGVRARVRGRHMARHGMGSMHHCERESECLLS